MKLTFILFVVLISTTVGAMAFGAGRWRRNNAAFCAKMQAARAPTAMTAYDAREIESLPPPVQRYFRAVLQDGQAMVSSVRLSQQGQFRQNESKDSWQPFRATQFVTIQPPGFDWDARIRMAPGAHVYVQDAYALGVGSLHAAVLGLVTVADMHGTPETARGELMRYLAEAPWYPTALLPCQGVRWEGIDDTSARATLTDGGTTVSLEFRFDADGLITTAWAPSRPRSTTESAPWLCRVRSYAQRAGMRVPLEGQVEWQLPNGPAPYWRGRLTGIDYEFASAVIA